MGPLPSRCLIRPRLQYRLDETPSPAARSPARPAGAPPRGAAPRPVRRLDRRAPRADAISVEAHVSNVGWRAAVGSGGTAGTTIDPAPSGPQVRLSRELSARYTVWYRVLRRVRRLGWACDSADAGSADYGSAVGPSGRGPAQGRPARATPPPVRRQVLRAPSVSYRAHVAGIGWQGSVSDSAVAGTTDRTPSGPSQGSVSTAGTDPPPSR
ncbi:MAG: hypothetical protein ACLUQW_06625 [Collinsella sp.]